MAKEDGSKEVSTPNRNLGMRHTSKVLQGDIIIDEPVEKKLTFSVFLITDF